MLCTTMTIGVYKMNHPIDTSEPLRADDYQGIVYAWKVDSGRLTKGDQDSKREYTTREFQDGDIVEMILDLNNLSLEYVVDGINHGKAFDIEETEYVAVVSLSRDNQIKLIDSNYN